MSFKDPSIYNLIFQTFSFLHAFPLKDYGFFFYNTHAICPAKLIPLW